MTGRDIMNIYIKGKLESLLVLKHEPDIFYFYTIDVDGFWRRSQTYATEKEAIEHYERWLESEVW